MGCSHTAVRELDAAIARRIAELSCVPLRELERATAEKRRQWVRAVRPQMADEPVSPRRAYELFLGDYLGLDLGEVPVVADTAERIVWRSVNPCPMPEACARLGLDTRRICRAIYEKSTQAFLSALDPALRFHRSYRRIRPHEPFCEEWIVRVDFASLMKIAIAEAEVSRGEGNKGHGAVVAFDGEVVARAHDTRAVHGDPSLHAEVNAIRAAREHLGDADLSGAVLVSTCEPCPMCSPLAAWANVTAIVFGASLEETERVGEARVSIPAREVVARLPANVEVIGGVLRDECLALCSR